MEAANKREETPREVRLPAAGNPADQHAKVREQLPNAVSQQEQLAQQNKPANFGVGEVGFQGELPDKKPVISNMSMSPDGKKSGEGLPARYPPQDLLPASNHSNQPSPTPPESRKSGGEPPVEEDDQTPKKLPTPLPAAGGNAEVRPSAKPWATGFPMFGRKSPAEKGLEDVGEDGREESDLEQPVEPPRNQLPLPDADTDQLEMQKRMVDAN